MTTYQLGMEPRYTAHVMALWIEYDMPCEIRIRKAKADGLVVVDVTDTELANKILLATKCKVYIKGNTL